MDEKKYYFTNCVVNMSCCKECCEVVETPNENDLIIVKDKSFVVYKAFGNSENFIEPADIVEFRRGDEIIKACYQPVNDSTDIYDLENNYVIIESFKK